METRVLCCSVRQEAKKKKVFTLFHTLIASFKLSSFPIDAIFHSYFSVACCSEEKEEEGKKETSSLFFSRVFV